MAAQGLNPTVEQLLDQVAQRIAEHLHQLQHAHHGAAAQPDRSPWMNAASAAAYLDWALQRLYKLTAQGAIPHYKHDGRLLFHRHELDAWLGSYAQGERPTS